MMEKDPAAHRRHQPGLGALPSGAAPGLAKVASEGPELQRSRSVGGLLQKGDPPSHPRKPHREQETEDQAHDPRTDKNDPSGQADLEEDRKEKDQDAQGTLDRNSGKMEPETKRRGVEASTKGEEEDTGCCSREAELSCLCPLAQSGLASPSPLGLTLASPLDSQEQELEPIKLVSHLEKEKPSAFVEIDLGDHTKEVTVRAVREEMWAQMDTGDLSEDETKTSWVCCIPCTTRRKTKRGVAAVEKAP
ncbi:uncharacterized protein LOC101726574 [Heterocephalus glaber]|uniref:Uncharacterized protein LOC101726574 n=1 Tax=Heterocephalus glaber TaxID=10181 RepID=A0AAX6RCB5_HETGA|nr:uncharacterized protein LOC101726574 [Heterocephalus glaber]